MIEHLVDGDLRVLEGTPAPGSALEAAYHRQLDEAVWGTEGVLYRSPDYGAHIDEAPDARLFRLEIDGALAGTYAIFPRTITLDGEPIEAFYRSGLTIAPAFAGRGFGRRLVRAVRSALLDGEGGRRMAFGWIDGENVRSMRSAASAGYRPVGTFDTIFFSRFFPRDDDAVRPATAADHAQMRARFDAAAAGHLLYAPSDAAHPSLWVVEEAGEIIAATTVWPRTWEMVRIPGVTGRLARDVLPHAPILGRVMPGRRWAWLHLGCLWAAEGHERAVLRLASAALYRHGRHTAMVYVDRRSPIVERIMAVGGRGLIDALGMGATGYCMAGFAGFDDAEIEALGSRPLWLSPDA